MTIRLFIAAFALLGIYVGVRWVKDQGMPTQPAPLEMQARDLPATIGEWKGENATLDKDMFEAIGAEMAINRKYQDRNGRVILLHMAVFEKSNRAQGPPHMPEVCFSASGWKLSEPRYVSLDQSGATGNSAKFLPMERGGEMGYLLFWYQIDGTAYCSGDSQRRLILACRGRPVRPPIVKVMLQTSAATPDEAQKTLQSFASEVFAWSRSFH